MCRLRNIAMRDYQESVTTGQTDRHTHRDRRRKSDPYVPLCFAGDTTIEVDYISHLHLCTSLYSLIHWNSIPCKSGDHNKKYATDV